MSESCRILVADDEDLFRDTTADLLRKAYYTVDCAADAVEAARRLSENDYDALVCDIKMPGNAELQFILEASESAVAMPIILVTGYPSVATAIEAVRLSIAAYLVKPIDIELLLQEVGEAVERSRLYRIVADLRVRLKLWDEDASHLERICRVGSDAHVAASAGSLLRIPLEMVGKAAVDLHRLVSLRADAATAALPQDSVNLLSRLDLCADAIRQTVEALEQSKYAFKSKRLKVLRQQLQGLLGVLEQPPVHRS